MHAWNSSTSNTLNKHVVFEHADVTTLHYADYPGILVLDLYKHLHACKRNRAVPLIVGRFKALHSVQLGSLLDPLIKHLEQTGGF